MTYTSVEWDKISIIGFNRSDRAVRTVFRTDPKSRHSFVRRTISTSERTPNLQARSPTNISPLPWLPSCYMVDWEISFSSMQWDEPSPIERIRNCTCRAQHSRASPALASTLGQNGRERIRHDFDLKNEVLLSKRPRYGRGLTGAIPSSLTLSSIRSIQHVTPWPTEEHRQCPTIDAVSP